MSRWSRFLTVLLAAAQLLLPAALSIADAMESADAGTAVVHVEDTSRAGCRAPHPTDCTVCRYLSGLVATTSGGSFDVAWGMRAQAAGLGTVAVDSRPRHGVFSRAPPGFGV